MIEKITTEATSQEIIQNLLDNPRIFNELHLVAGTDRGFNSDAKHSGNGDFVAVKYGSDWVAFVFGDGVGSHLNSDLAAGLVARSFIENVSQESDLRQFHQDTHDLLRRNDCIDSAVAYTLARANLKKMKLEISPVGDCQLMVLGSDGTIRHLTKPKRLRKGNKEYLAQAVTGEKLTDIDDPYPVDIFEGDRIIAATDPLWDNFSPEEVAVMATGRSAEEAFRVLTKAMEVKMTVGLPENIADMISGKPMEEALQIIADNAGKGPKGKGDNRALLIWDIQTLG